MTHDEFVQVIILEALRRGNNPSVELALALEALETPEKAD